MSRFTSRRPLFGILAGVSVAGVIAMIYLPFLPSNGAVILAFLFTALCMTAVLWHILAGHSEAARDRNAAAEFHRTGASHQPVIGAIVTTAILGLFSFFTAAYLLSGVYTRLIGDMGERTLTVSSRYWGKRCFETRFKELPALTQVFRALCLAKRFNEGETVVVYGYTTWLGTYVEQVGRQTSPNTSLERTRDR